MATMARGNLVSSAGLYSVEHIHAVCPSDNASDTDDAGNPTVQYGNGLVISFTSNCDDSGIDDLPTDIFPYNKTGDVWDFENVPEDIDDRIRVIRTTFPCHACQRGVWDGSYEPDMDKELAVSLDEHGILLYNVEQQSVTGITYASMRSIQHIKRTDINILLIESADDEGSKRQYALAARNTAEIKAALISMIQRHTQHTARAKVPPKFSQKLASFIFGT